MSDAKGLLPGFEHLTDTEPLRVVQALLGRVHDIVVAVDATGTVRFTNEAVAEHLGFAPDAVVGRSLLDFVATEDVEAVDGLLARWRERTGRPRGSEVALRTSSGSVRHFHYRSQTGDALFGPDSFVITVSPATPDDQRADLVPALIENANRIARIAAAFLDEPVGNFSRALDGAVRELSGLEWLTRVTLWTLRDADIELTARWDAAFGAPTAAPPGRLRIDISPMLRRLVAGEEVRMTTGSPCDPELEMERRNFAAAGTQSLLAVPLVASEELLGILVLESTVADFTGDAAHLATVRAAGGMIAAAMLRNRAEAGLAYQARTDRTTGLSNRWAAHTDLDEALATLGVGEAAGVGVIGIDLDRFKLVNEALGHRSGDLLLADVSDRLRSAAPAMSQLARLSADEFLVVVPDTESEALSARIAHKILEVFSVPFDVGGSTISVTARAGVVHVSGGDASASAVEVLRRVANTVDQAKRSGRSVETFDPNADSQLRRLRRVSELENALAEGLLVPYFQAEWDLTTRRIIGAEALLRWTHPTEGLLGANQVIPLAESTGLIGRIGRRVLTEACRAALGWLDIVDDFVLRVNVSARQLRSGEFADEVADVLDETGFPAASLCLELTESSLLDDPARSRQHFARLRALGVGLAIDDFGTGYSSILQLKELPLSSLKIDQRFVAGVADDPSDRAIVEATLELARAFGVSTTAEGVEDERQRKVLEALGCVRVQGFLFSGPETAECLTARLTGSSVGSSAGPGDGATRTGR